MTTLTTWEELIFLVHSDKEFQKEVDKMLVEVIMLGAERSYLEEQRTAETFEIKYRKELVLEVSGYVCKKKLTEERSLGQVTWKSSLTATLHKSKKQLLKMYHLNEYQQREQ